MADLEICPKCGYRAKSSDDPLITAHDGVGECPVCGILVSKYKEPSVNEFRKFKERRSSRRLWAIGIGGPGILVILALSYLFYPPFTFIFINPGDSAYGSVAESSGELSVNYTTFSKGKYVRVRSFSERWTWTAKAEGDISVLALSTNGRYLATVGRPNILQIWEKGFLTCKLRFELQGNIKTISAVSFSFDERYLVVLGDDDQKIDIYELERQDIIATEEFKSEQFDAFRLAINIDAREGSGRVEMSRAQFVSIREAVLPGRGIRKLRDNVSGEFVKSYNDGWKANFEPAKSLSWNPEGRYSAYAEQDKVLIWKLCPSEACKFKVEG